MIFVYDIGGTHVKFGVFSTENGVYSQAHSGFFPTEVSKGGKHIISELSQHIHRLKESYALEGIAISSAGQINSHTGEVVYASESIPAYTGLNPKLILEKDHGVPVSIENDVNCFLLGERHLSSLEGYILAITLGTGIGGAVFIEDRLYKGASGVAGEIGHFQLYKDGRLCTCGSKGCFEQYASTKALVDTVATVHPGLNILDFFKGCKSGESDLLRTLDRWIDALTDGLKSCLLLLNPHVIAIGGAISDQGLFLQNRIEASLRMKVMPTFFDGLRVYLSPHGNMSNLIGALCHHREEVKGDINVV